MNYDIDGVIALVSGASSGIGFATAQLLLQHGARVAVTAKDRDSTEAAAAKLAQFGEVLAVAGDLTDAHDISALHQTITEKMGSVQILVNTAGITGATGMFHELTDDQWQLALDTNFLAAVRLRRAFIPGMVDQQWGRVALIGSEDAMQPYADELPYCAAKVAILNLAKGLSKTYAIFGILVNAVSPAFIATPMTDAMMQKRAEKNGTSFDEAIRSFLKDERPTLELKRRGEPEEVAAAIVFLCSKGASFVNGTNLRVDGGSVATV